MYDVLVLGSGIAGLTTALHAAARACRSSCSPRVSCRTRRRATRRAASPPHSRTRTRPTCTWPTRSPPAPVSATSTPCACSSPRARRASASSLSSAPTSTPHWTPTAGSCSSPAKAVTRSRASCTPVVTQPAPRSSARSSQPSIPARSRCARVGSPSTSSSTVGCAAVCEAIGPGGERERFLASNTVLATGGVGQCFAVTTNPTLSTGDGIALALRAGVACADLEFVQFHPTALHHPSMPRPLLSEALRGEGAVLRDGAGDAFMAGVHPLADLAPRDVVSRAIHQRMREHRHGSRVPRRVDDRRLPEPLPDDLARVPVGGSRPDAATASRSRPRRTISRVVSSPISTAQRPSRICGRVAKRRAAASTVPTVSRRTRCSTGSCSAAGSVEAIDSGRADAEDTGAMTGVLDVAVARAATDPSSATGPSLETPAKIRAAIQRTMSADCGVVRDAPSLRAAASDACRSRTDGGRPSRRRDRRRARSATCVRVSQAIVPAARAREESRGAHTPCRLPRYERRVAGTIRAPRRRRAGVRPAPGTRAGRDHDRVRPSALGCSQAVVADALAEDFGAARRHHVAGDASTKTQKATPRSSRATAGVLAGTAAAAEVFRQVDASVVLQWDLGDGDRVDPKERRSAGCTARSARSSAENGSRSTSCRTAPGSRRSRAGASDAVGPDVRIRDTRKTLPGLRALQRAAVRAGGGFNHRDSLSDAGADQGQPSRRAAALADRLSRGPARCGRVGSSKSSATRSSRSAKRATAGVDIVMLDNMTPKQVREAVEAGRRRVPGRGFGRRHPRLGARVRTSGVRLHLDRRAHPLGARARHRPRLSTMTSTHLISTPDF